MSHTPSVYPIILTCLDHVLTVVIGGGQVGERKIAGLLQANARIRLVSPQATVLLQDWVVQGRIEWEPRNYRAGDLTDAWLAIVATNQRKVNAEAAYEARQRCILCNVADAPGEGNFHVPAVHRGAQELIAVSAYGRSPARAAALRTRIANWLKGNETE